MYRLDVFEPDASSPAATHAAANSSDVLSLITSLLQAHPDCERIVVFEGSKILFEVSCGGFPLRA